MRTHVGVLSLMNVHAQTMSANQSALRHLAKRTESLIRVLSKALGNTTSTSGAPMSASLAQAVEDLDQ
jgi:hypothetical protein